VFTDWVRAEGSQRASWAGSAVDDELSRTRGNVEAVRSVSSLMMTVERTNGRLSQEGYWNNQLMLESFYYSLSIRDDRQSHVCSAGSCTSGLREQAEQTRSQGRAEPSIHQMLFSLASVCL